MSGPVVPFNQGEFEKITPASAQRDIEKILDLKPGDPDFEIYYRLTKL